uniref:biotin/lipoyl-binding protein n=1 Tax=Klebsiella variicola TaxID=244366 RepID=UPI00396A79B1
MDEGDYVEKGQPLVLLDPSDTAIALQQAEANLASTVRQVRGLYSTADNYRAQVAAKKVALQTAKSDYLRREKIVSSGAIAVEDLAHYRDAVTSAQSDLLAAEQALKTNQAMVDDTVVDNHPEVKTAVATLRQRYLDNSRSTIVAPVSGYVAKLCSVSFLTMGASCLMRAQFNTDVDFRTIASVQMFMGIGVAFFFMPLTTIVLSNLHGNEVAEGSGLATFFRVLGGSFASSLTTWIWQRREVFHHANLTESVTQYNPAAMDYVNKMGGPTQQHLAMIDQVVTQQAYMMSTIDYFWVLGWGFMALIIIIWFTRPPFVKSGMPGAPAAGH